MIKPFAEAWRYIKKNPQILVPKAVYLAITIFLGLIFQKYFGVLSTFVDNQVFTPEAMTSEVVRSLGYVLGYGIFLFFIGVIFSAMIYGLIADLIKKNKCVLSNCKNYLKNYFKPILFMQLWMGLIYAISAIVAFIPSMLLSAMGLTQASMPAFVITASAIYIVITLSLFFRYPILIFENKKPREALKESYGFFKKNPKSFCDGNNIKPVCV